MLTKIKDDFYIDISKIGLITIINGVLKIYAPDIYEPDIVIANKEERDIFLAKLDEYLGVTQNKSNPEEVDQRYYVNPAVLAKARARQDEMQKILQPGVNEF